MDECPSWRRPQRCIGRNALNTQIYEGTNQIQRVVVAKHLLR